MKVENVICAIGTTVITVMERGKHVGILLALSSSDDEDDESSDEDISNVITSVLLISYVQPYMSYGEGREYYLSVIELQIKIIRDSSDTNHRMISGGISFLPRLVCLLLPISVC